MCVAMYFSSTDLLVIHPKSRNTSLIFIKWRISSIFWWCFFDDLWDIAGSSSCGISYLYVDIFREHDLFVQRFLRLYFMRVCVGPSQIWRIPVEPLVHTCVTRYMRSVADERVCTHRACLHEQTRAYMNEFSVLN